MESEVAPGRASSRRSHENCHHSLLLTEGGYILVQAVYCSRGGSGDSTVSRASTVYVNTRNRQGTKLWRKLSMGS